MSSFKLWLKYAKPSHGRPGGRRGRRAGAARARHEPAARGHRGGGGRVRGGRRGGGARPTAAPIGKGIVNYSAEELRRIKGLKTDDGARAAAAGEPRRPCTATTSCSSSCPVLDGRRYSPLPWPMATTTRSVADDLRCGARPPRARSRRLDTRNAERRAARRWRTRSRRAPTRSSRPTRATWRPAQDDGLGAALLDRLKLDRGSAGGHRRGRARRSPRCPTRSARRSRATGCRTGSTCGGARAARRGGRRLRGAAERDDRLLGALPQVGQRDRAARVLDRGALERGAGARSRRDAVASAGLPAAASRSWPGGDRDELRRARHPGRRGRPDHPARGRGAEERAEGARDGAGDVRGGGQLPRLRGRVAPTWTTPWRSR